MDTPSLNQRSYLCALLKDDGYPFDQCWDKTENITKGEYKLLLAYIFNKKSEELAKFLTSLGIQKYGTNPLSSLPSTNEL